MTDRVELRRVIAGPREEVFRAWTDPEELKQWWGPGEFTCPEAEVDLRPGGRYRLVMQPAAGDPLVLGDRTEMVLVHTGFPESHGPDPYRMGWEGGFEKFEALFASRQSA